MRKLLTIIALGSFAIAQSLQMPPAMPPIMMEKKDSKKITKPSSECDNLPPMLHILPPPLQEALDKCQVEKFMPKESAVKAYLSKNKIKYKEIEIKPAKDFIRVYEVDLKNGTKLFCNEKVSRCIEMKK